MTVTHLADIDGYVFLLIRPVAQCQAQLLLAVESKQFHFLHVDKMGKNQRF